MAIRHLTLLLSTLRYTLAVVRFNTGSTVAQFTYRLAFLSAAVTYGIVVFKAYRAKIQKGQGGNPQQQALSLLSDENVQYLSMWNTLQRGSGRRMNTICEQS